MILEPKIIHEDEDIIVVNKPSGMTVNKADTTKDEVTLQDWVEKNFGETNTTTITYQKEEKGVYNPIYEFFNRGGIVHRLDKETSGIILIAKNVESFVRLQKQFKERTTHKSYIALAHGRIAPAEGEISVPVGRLPFNRKKFGVIAGGREALTQYKVLKYFDTKKVREGNFKLVELYPKTGRTHQIRVHLKYINHPIVSDPIYAGRKVGRDDRKMLGRLFLHAFSIIFVHPRTNAEVHFENPLPDELEEFLQTLQ